MVSNHTLADKLGYPSTLPAMLFSYVQAVRNRM